MYIEKKWNYNYLIKKVAGKKVSVNIWEDSKITQEHIKELSKKEFSFLSSQNSFYNFKTELYNPDLLDEVYFESIYLSNQMSNKIPSNSVNLKHKDFPIKFIYESNKTEWSKIPYESVKQIIKEKKYIYKVKNEILEVKNSLKVWEFINSSFLFNVSNIKKLYHILTNWLLQENWLKYPRWFKKAKIVVNNNSTTPPEDVENEIKSLLLYYKTYQKIKNPLWLAFDFHLKYEQIHPFENWNWRTGRFLLNKILLANNLLPMIVFEENRQAYFNAIDSTKTWNKKKYYKFMLEQYSKTVNEYWKK